VAVAIPELNGSHNWSPTTILLYCFRYDSKYDDKKAYDKYSKDSKYDK
jgi:hypothetical protein